MLLCDPTIEDKVMNHKNYTDIRHNRDAFKLLQVKKQCMYWNTHGAQSSYVYNHPV